MTFALLLRRGAVLAGVALALPITCARPGDGIYNAGVQPSPASRVNPAEPGFVNDRNHR
jgi:hypothetical protein